MTHDTAQTKPYITMSVRQWQYVKSIISKGNNTNLASFNGQPVYVYPLINTVLIGDLEAWKKDIAESYCNATLTDVKIDEFDGIEL